jgi:hypothetical protein
VETNDTDAVVTHGILAATRYRDRRVAWTDDFHVLVCLFRSSNIPRPSVKVSGGSGKRKSSWYAVLSGTQLSEHLGEHFFEGSLEEGDDTSSSSAREWAARLFAAGVASIGCDFVEPHDSMTFKRVVDATRALCVQHPHALAAMRHASGTSDEDVLGTLESISTLLSLAGAGREHVEVTYAKVLRIAWTLAYWLSNEREAACFGWTEPSDEPGKESGDEPSDEPTSASATPPSSVASP